MIRLMEAGTDTADSVPFWRCGRGQMRVLCAGKIVNHVGRYFYKCLGNVNHLGSFMGIVLFLLGVIVGKLL